MAEENKSKTAVKNKSRGKKMPAAATALPKTPKDKEKTVAWTKKNQELELAILEDISKGFPVRAACDNNGINQDTWYVWLSRDPELVKNYLLAKSAAAERMAEEILEIADDSGADMYHGAQGSAPNRAAVERSKLMVDSRKWLLSKLLPKKYGDKMIHAGDADAPVSLVFDNKFKGV